VRAPRGLGRECMKVRRVGADGCTRLWLYCDNTNSVRFLRTGTRPLHEKLTAPTRAKWAPTGRKREGAGGGREGRKPAATSASPAARSQCPASLAPVPAPPAAPAPPPAWPSFPFSLVLPRCSPGASVRRERAYLAIDPRHVGIPRGAIRDPDVSPYPLLAQGITIPRQ